MNLLVVGINALGETPRIVSRAGLSNVETTASRGSGQGGWCGKMRCPPALLILAAIFASYTSALRTLWQSIGPSFAQDAAEEQRVADQVAAGKPTRFLIEPPEPFVPKTAQVAPLVDFLIQPNNPQLDLMAGQALSIAHGDASEKIARAALDLYYRMTGM